MVVPTVNSDWLKTDPRSVSKEFFQTRMYTVAGENVISLDSHTVDRCSNQVLLAENYIRLQSLDVHGCNCEAHEQLLHLMYV